MPDRPTIIVTADGRYRDANASALDLLGVTLDELRSSDPGRFAVEPADAEADAAFREAWEASGKPDIGGATTIRRADGAKARVKFAIREMEDGSYTVLLTPVPATPEPTTVYTVGDVLAAWRASERQLEDSPTTRLSGWGSWPTSRSFARGISSFGEDSAPQAEATAQPASRVSWTLRGDRPQGGPMRPTLMVNPRSDALLTEWATTLVLNGVRTPSDLEAALRDRYPRVKVRERSLSHEPLPCGTSTERDHGYRARPAERGSPATSKPPLMMWLRTPLGSPRSRRRKASLPVTDPRLPALAKESEKLAAKMAQTTKVETALVREAQPGR